VAIGPLCFGFVSVMLACMRRTGTTALSALALILAGCGDTPPAADKAAIEKTVKAVEASIQKATVAKDAAAFSSYYADNAVFMSPGAEALKGRPAIRAAMATMFADPALKLDFAADRVEISDAGDMAATRGNYTLAVTDPATKKVIHDKGSYVTVFRKQTDGAWKAVLDINTSEVAPAPMPAPKAAAVAKKKGKKKR
jgi:uncharacterized protein (TIGR02246 family)